MTVFAAEIVEVIPAAVCCAVALVQKTNVAAEMPVRSTAGFMFRKVSQAGRRRKGNDGKFLADFAFTMRIVRSIGHFSPSEAGAGV